MNKEISFIIPSRNTIKYTQIAYQSIRRYYPTFEIVILDESDSDTTWEWLLEIKKTDDNLLIWKNPGKMLGHCITYDLGIKMARNDLFSIFHSDMVCSEGYVENMLKHWKPKRVISATRVEPEGIYPPGKEKILKPFGATVEEFHSKEFDEFVKQEQSRSTNMITRGIFAPWLMSKDDFFAIGGHDHVSFAPWPTEDSDIFLRFVLAKYELIQSRDSLCYHFISKGHRNWAKNGIGKDDPDFKFYQRRSIRNYLRKWHKMFSYDEHQYPIPHPVYDVGFVVKASTLEFIHLVEPWCTKIYLNDIDLLRRYIEQEQPTTNVDLSKRVLMDTAEDSAYHDVLVYFDEKSFRETKNDDKTWMLQHLTDMITESNIQPKEKMEGGPFTLYSVGKVKDISETLIKVENPIT